MYKIISIVQMMMRVQSVIPMITIQNLTLLLSQTMLMMMMILKLREGIARLQGNKQVSSNLETKNLAGKRYSLEATGTEQSTNGES